MIRVDKIIPGGQALGTMPDGRKIFFWNALPGELVTDYEMTKQKSHYIEATALAVNDKSPHRVAPKDECFLSTSPWQIIEWDYENQLKRELVTEIFREHQITLDPGPVVTDCNDYYYRNKMEYALYWDNEQDKISLAFHKRGSHRKIPITQSSIERPEIFSRAQAIVDELNAKHEEARKYQSLLLRCNQAGQVSGGLYENHRPHPIFKNLTDSILGHSYSYSPNGFFQINLPVYELALTEIKKYIHTDKVLDLYSGVGTIGLSVALGHKLTLVECDKFAFSELRKNCDSVHSEIIRDNGSGSQNESYRNIMPILAKSEETLDYIEEDQTVILDPPRAGCDRKLIDKLIEIKPEKIIYLSCNPATQARDVKMLLDTYEIEATKTFNFFPRTPHIENFIVLSRQ